MKSLFDPRWLFTSCAFLVVVAVLAIFGFILWTALPAIELSGPYMLFGATWDYSRQLYGMENLILSTMFLTVISMFLAVPMGLMTAVYLAEYASSSIEKMLRPLIELLVGIPSVVYGIFGFFVLKPVFRDSINPGIGAVLGFIPLFRNPPNSDGASYILAACVMVIMVLPTIVALSQEAFKSVPASYREASYAVGATKWETIRYIVIPAAIGGIVTSFVLAAMRVMGETMAVVMLLGEVTTAPGSILDTGTVMTAKIVNDANYYMSLPDTKSALFAIAIVLFVLEIGSVALIRVISSKLSEET